MIDSAQEPSDNHFPSVDLNGAGFNLADFHARVSRNNGRVEIVRDGNTCVLISKAELEGLEKALEILSNTETVRAMRDQIALVANFATPQSRMAPPEPSANSRVRSLNLP